ncbi:MAG: serine protease [Dysgonamonadaceae bacterium]|nr:serine protease [Dysgonamonadaceae bacterium]
MMSCTSIIDQGMEVMVEEEVYTSRFHVHYVDNCGYLLLEDIEGLDNTGFYKPVNLPEEYKQEGLRVDVTYRYRLLRGETCNCSERSIEIEGIMETPETQTRITGGYTVNISQIPWQVAVVRMGNLDCGGVIIAPGFILTAKHCVTIPDTQIPLPPSFIQVRAGVSCPIDPNSGNRFDVARIIVHPNDSVDAALLQLSSNITYSDNMKSINYWASSNSTLYSPGNQVRTSGWGLMDITPGGALIAAPCLQAVDLTIVPNETTINVWKERLPAHEMVATGTGNIRQGGCNGDSGGPLTIRSASGEHLLIGIVRGGVTCEGSNEFALSVFTRVSSLLDWILPHTAAITGPSVIYPNSSASFTVSNIQSSSIMWTSSSNLVRTSPSIPVGETATFSWIDTKQSEGWINVRLLDSGVQLRHIVRSSDDPAPPVPPNQKIFVRYIDFGVESHPSAFVGLGQPIVGWQFYDRGIPPQNIPIMPFGGRRFGGVTFVELVADFTNDDFVAHTITPEVLQMEMALHGSTSRITMRDGGFTHSPIITSKQIASGATVRLRFSGTIDNMTNYTLPPQTAFASQYAEMHVTLSYKLQGAQAIHFPRQKVERRLAWR